MKTSIKTLFAAILTLGLGITAPSFANSKENQQVTVLSQIKNFNKLNVAGNVEVILVQSNNQSVQVYDNYYAKNALVQEKNGELRISSFNKEILTVVVYASQLSEINVSDNSTIKTLGKFSTLSLAVNLKDEAKASLNTNTVDLSANVIGHAALNLTGSTSEYNATIGTIAAINMNNFTSETSNIQSRNSGVAKHQDTKNQLPENDMLTIF
jgi:hypothetical protein